MDNAVVFSKSQVMTIATTIKNQLLGSTDINIPLSWGLQGFIATIYKDMATLKFKVNGRLFKGYVLICYNQLDNYDIYLSDKGSTRCLCDMVDFTDLVEIIDTAIEKGTNEEEYEQFCLMEKKKLFSGQF